MNTSPKSESRGELGEIVMTSSGWCDTDIQANVLFMVLKQVFDKRHAGYDL